MAKAEMIPVLEFPQARGCTCHPDDKPPVPCAQKYAHSECVAAAALDEIRNLALAWKQAQDVFTAWHKENELGLLRLQYGSEAWIRKEVEKKTRVMAVVDARTQYERACDDFFLRESEQSEAAE